MNNYKILCDYLGIEKQKLTKKKKIRLYSLVFGISQNLLNKFTIPKLDKVFMNGLYSIILQMLDEKYVRKSVIKAILCETF